jgi:hypothetical protein
MAGSDGAYARDFAEVKVMGSATSTVRTAQETTTARFWTATSSQMWNQPAQQLAAVKRLTVLDSARLFAQLNFAIADAAIAAWDTKFTYNQWRPVSGIREADTDPNPQTRADPQWSPLLATPPFPDYVCGHSAFGAAAQAVLESYFGRRPGPALTLRNASLPEVTHRFASFRDIGDEVVNARVWGGVHWRTSCEAGRSMGRDVGRFVATHALPRSRGRH